ncbi:hypothetical protein [Flavobacterium sp.]|uniref:hypothetical protein n=1 Tax=Flavobacterium sp. TaxID=239 RepID=UPI003B9C6DB9
MKYLLVCCMALSLLVSPETSKEKKLLGVWKFENVAQTEHVSGNIFRNVTSGLKDEILITFQPDHTGIIKDVDLKTKASFTWELKSGHLAIIVEIQNSILQSLNGTFRMQFAGKKELKLVAPDGKVVTLSRPRS